jgi:hypothetical protein
MYELQNVKEDTPFSWSSNIHLFFTHHWKSCGKQSPNGHNDLAIFGEPCPKKYEHFTIYITSSSLERTTTQLPQILTWASSQALRRDHRVNNNESF